MNSSSSKSAAIQRKFTCNFDPPVCAEAIKQPTPVTALVVSRMNDVLSLHENTQAAWWNRIPLGAWGMMGVIAAFGSAMIGNIARARGTMRFPIFHFFMADLDSLYGGFIHVRTHDFVSLGDWLKQLPSLC